VNGQRLRDQVAVVQHTLATAGRFFAELQVSEYIDLHLLYPACFRPILFGASQPDRTAATWHLEASPSRG
jgi:hypothetical protein